MTHVTPFVLAAGRGVQGSSLGYHAYSLRVDNCSNQWLQEESTLVWIPPYSLGVVLRLWGTSVALIIPAAPTGQAQQAAIAGEYAVAVYSDEYRTENPGVPIRQFTLVQAVSDLTEGPQPALPPVGVCRIYADANGVLWHLHSDGTFYQLIDTNTNAGGVLSGKYPNPGIGPLVQGATTFRSTGLGALGSATGPGIELLFNTNSTPPQGTLQGYDRTAGTYQDVAITGHNLILAPQGGGYVAPNLDMRSAQSNTGKAANFGAWGIYNFQVDLPAQPAYMGPATWFVWWTAHFQNSTCPAGTECDTNLWSAPNPPTSLIAEYGARQFNTIVNTAANYYSCSGFGFVQVNPGPLTLVLATYPGNGNIVLSPGVGGAFSRIYAMRIGQ